MKKLAITAAIATALSAAAVLPAQAQESLTLKKIKDTGTITLGHRESSIPFSYYDDKQQVIGYSHELMLKAVEGIKAELKLAKIDIKLMPVTSANRITLVQNGTIDIECGSTTNNLERQKQVGFSTTIFVIGTKLMAKKTAGINDFADLVGKNVVTTAGTTSERLLRRMNEEKKMGMSVISAKDHGEAFLTLETGRAVAGTRRHHHTRALVAHRHRLTEARPEPRHHARRHGRGDHRRICGARTGGLAHVGHGQQRRRAPAKRRKPPAHSQ